MKPDLSIVMAVYNGESQIGKTLDSVLPQLQPTYEFIIVDDGSTDGTRDQLRAAAAGNNNITILSRPHRGLTQSLIDGCNAAQGVFIARQDCGDRSLPGRFHRQLDLVRSRADASMVSCGTRVVGPRGEHLYDNVLTESEGQEGLASADHERLRGPSHHGATMFRRETYQQVGGYRSQFKVGQDLDLWVRLAELGPHLADPPVFYEAHWSEHGISAMARSEQVELKRLIVEMSSCRRSGSAEDEILERVAALTSSRRHKPAQARAAALYHVARCLLRRDPKSARTYLADAIRHQPLFWRAWAAYVLTLR